MPRKLEAQLAGRYWMSRVLITSTMKSEPATPPMRLVSIRGVPVSAAICVAVGGNADGRPAGADPAAGVAFATDGATAAPATATPVKNLRRSTFGPEILRAMLRL